MSPPIGCDTLAAREVGVSTFEFTFSLFGLLLGLSLAEVLGGLGKATKARPRVRIGWLTPLLAAFVMLDLIGFWTIAWTAREALPATYLTLVFGLLISGSYFLAASWLFPEDIHGADLDEHYFRQKTKIFAIIAACQLFAHAGRLLVIAPEAAGLTAASAIVVGCYFALIIPAIFARGKALNIALLIALLLLYAADAAQEVLRV